MAAEHDKSCGQYPKLPIEKLLSLEALPLEIMNEILKYLLLESKTVYPYRPHNHTDTPLATGGPGCLAIMRVNKRLNQEATVILYAGAAFWLSTGCCLIKFFAGHTKAKLKLPPQCGNLIPSRHLISQVRIKLVPQTIDPFLSSSVFTGFWKTDNVERMDSRERRILFHKTGVWLTMRHWASAFHILTRLQGLKHLTLNIQTAFCAHGCCRLITELCGIARDYPFPQPDLRVTVEGSIRCDEVIQNVRAARVAGAGVTGIVTGICETGTKSVAQ